MPEAARARHDPAAAADALLRRLERRDDRELFQDGQVLGCGRVRRDHRGPESDPPVRALCGQDPLQGPHCPRPLYRRSHLGRHRHPAARSGRDLHLADADVPGAGEDRRHRGCHRHGRRVGRAKAARQTVVPMQGRRDGGPRGRSGREDPPPPEGVMMRGLATVLVALLLGFGGSSWAGYDEGKAAAERGDYATALREWQALADKGDPRAETGLGVLYARGLGVKQDYGQALTWFRKAADQGFARAQDNLAIMYLDGKGVARNPAEGIRLLRLAAGQGDAQAEADLGLAYEQGTGVPPDYAEALKWYRKAADQHNAEGQYSIGAMYALGKGVAQDQREAATWYRRAADQGLVQAQYALAALYVSGEGVTRDYTLAM